MKFIVKSFLQGLLVVVPLVVTGYVVWLVVTGMDELLGLGIHGLGLAATLVAICGVGWLTSNVVGRTLLGLVDRILARLPLVKLLYTSLRDLVGAFVGDTKKFDQPAAVTVLPHCGGRALGFVTRDSVDMPGAEGQVAVYFPQSYNFAGSVLLFPREHVDVLDVSSTEFMKFIVSGGVSGHEAVAAEA